MRQRPIPAKTPAAPNASLERSGRISVKISRDIAPALEVEARVQGMTPPAWVNTLLRRRLLTRPGLSRPEELAIISIQADLRRTAIHVGQVLQDLALLGDPTPGLEPLSEFRADIRDQLSRLRTALVGNFTYWDSGG